MPLQLPGALESQIRQGTSQYWASCWRIALTTIANRVYRFTDHPEDLTFPTLEVFRSMDGMDGSAEQRRDNFRGIDRDVRGLISDTEVTDQDLQKGLFTDAIVDEYLVDTRLAGIGPITVVRYYIKAASFDGATWNAEIDGVGSQYDQPVGENWGPVCRVEVFSTGEGKCNIPPDGFYELATLTAVLEQRSEFQFSTTNVLWDEVGFGNDGFVTFSSGDNNGWRSRIKTYTVAGGTGTVLLHERVPFFMQVGDIVSMLPGCNKQSIGIQGSPAHCVSRYDNILNFQGEAFIPGGDRARKGITIL